MDSLNELENIVESPTKNVRSSSGRGKKRKWREIEALKEKYRLKKELEELDIEHELSVDDIRI